MTRTDLKTLFAEHSFRPKKSLGQSFLVDSNFLEALSRDAGIGPDEGVIEVGSGPGNLTERLATRARRVWGIEIDPKLHQIASERLAGLGNVTLVCGDGADPDRHVSTAGTLRVVANLPYRDWERVLLGLLSSRLPVASYLLMVQDAVFDRIRSRPATKGYGPLPALVQGGCSIRKVRRAGRRLFHPAPRVDSVVFELRRTRTGLDFAGAAARLRRLFAHRRKKRPEAGGRRIEELSPSDLLNLVRQR